MTRRIFAAGLAAAALYAAIISATAPGQEPSPEPTAEATVTPIATPEPTATAAPVETPAATPPAMPRPTPFWSPVPGAAATAEPSATASPVATTTPEVTLEAVAPPGEQIGTTRRDALNREHARACATSTSTRRCDTGSERGDDQPRLAPAPRLRNADGSPARSNPTYSVALRGPARIGVPSFFIDKFRIPPFLLSIYQAAGMEYGIRWEILAAINEIETDYGRNLNVSTAGALGWMQFMPATWKSYGVDANRDGEKDPYNPVDAIFAAARYLRAAGADSDIKKAIFAYNHADWYVDSVLMRAQVIGGLPADLVGSLTGLTQGRFPVHAKATYAGALEREGNAAMLVDSDEARRGITIHAHGGAPVIAVQDARVDRIGDSRRLGRYVVLQDVYGNTYTYGHLGSTIPRSKGARVIGGTIVGRLARKAEGEGRAQLLFEIRPAGRGAPRIDPKPILDGWKLLESTAVYRAAGENPLIAADAEHPTIGQSLLMTKEQLARRVLGDARIQIYDCGRDDIRSGQVDRRVLATMLYLAASGLKPTVSSLTCGHGHYTSSGNVSHHSTGSAMDISAVNGIAIAPGTQGPDSVTDLTIQRLLTLQGTMKPTEIISLMAFTGVENTLAMGDHHDHIHVGWQPLYGDNRRVARQIDAALRPDQWIKLVDRLADITNPTVLEHPSRASVRAVRRGSRAHRGE